MAVNRRSNAGDQDALTRALEALNLLSPAELGRVVLPALDLMTEAGDRKARHAASIYRAPQNAGRKPIDDAEALKRIGELIAAGKDPRVVASIVAVGMTSDRNQRHAIAQRLRRKMKCT